MIFGNKYAKTRISTPYSKLSEKELLSRFKSDSWAKLNQQEKIDTIQELENRYAVEQKRPVSKIEAEDNPYNYGSYAKSENTIRIRMEDSEANTSYEILDSYYHESRHAQQYQAIESGKGLDETTRNVCQTELRGNYVGGGKYYDMQTCEMDSNNYAADKMMSNKALFEGDEKYNEYLERRQEHFEEVNKSCHDDVDFRARQQIKNVDKSLARGSITEKQANQIKEQVYSDNDDPVLAVSCSIENKLREENAEHNAMNNSDYTDPKVFDRAGNLRIMNNEEFLSLSHEQQQLFNQKYDSMSLEDQSRYDLEFGKAELDSYKRAVESGEVQRDEQLEQSLNVNISYLEQRHNDIVSGSYMDERSFDRSVMGIASMGAIGSKMGLDPATKAQLNQQAYDLGANYGPKAMEGITSTAYAQHGIYTPTPIVHEDKNGNKTYDYGLNESDEEVKPEEEREKVSCNESSVSKTEKHEQFFEDGENDTKTNSSINSEDKHRQFFEDNKSTDYEEKISEETNGSSEETAHEKHEQFFEDRGNSYDGGSSEGQSEGGSNPELSGESEDSGQSEQSFQTNSIT